MTSLTYHAEHRAWQERVLRESFQSLQRPGTRTPGSRTSSANYSHLPVKYRTALRIVDSSATSGRTA